MIAADGAAAPSADSDLVGDDLDPAEVAGEGSEDAGGLNGYDMRPDGLYAEIGTAKARGWGKVSGPFEIVGRVRDPHGDRWGRLVRWTDPDGRHKSEIVSDADLHHHAGELAARLADRGLHVVPGRGRYLVGYLDRVNVERRVTVVLRTGWHTVGGRRCYVLPTGTTGAPDDEEVVLDTDASTARFAAAGDLATWRAGVGALVGSHTRLVFAVSTALVGPLLALLGAEGGGVHLVGSSSIGKTTCALAAASVWGLGTVGEDSYMRTWRATANGLEGEAALHTDAVFVLDEIGMSESREVAAAVYQLAAGTGKGRADRAGHARQRKTWRVMFLSTGEVGLADKLAEDRRRQTAGQHVRMLDIPADARKGHGCFDHAGGTSNARDIADQIRSEAATCYGVAGPAFVAALVVTGVDQVATDAREMVERFRESLVPDGAGGQVQRAAWRFAMIGVAGELARDFGIVPWAEGVARAAAETCYRAWLDERGGDDQHEVLAGIERVRLMIQAHGDSRFERIDAAEPRLVVNRLGYTRGQGSSQQWLIPPETWRVEFGSVALAMALAERGMLLRDAGGETQRRETVAGHRRRYYVLTAAVMERNDVDPA